jgi:steroid delta-isomerase-like uncharacterized protein
MSTDANKDVVRRFVEQVLVKLNADAVDELVADDFISHNWPSDPDSRTALKAATQRVGQGLADISFSIDDLIAEDDRVVARVTSRARQVGPFMGMPASGRGYEIGEIHIFRLRDGKIVEHWYEMDVMGLMKQLKAD